MISIHAPREGSDLRPWLMVMKRLISIHAPREGSDQCQGLVERIRAISIHAPREGSDLPADTAMCATGDFNPRSP